MNLEVFIIFYILIIIRGAELPAGGDVSAASFAPNSFDGDAAVGVERRGRRDTKEGHVICNLCCVRAFHEVETPERRLQYANRRALVFGGEHSERGAEVLHQSVGDLA